MTRFMLPHSTPEAQGIASSAILAFVEEAEKNIHELHSFMLLRHGQVVAGGWWQPYAPDLPHMLFSLSKSFTSSAIGLAVSEGRLTLDDRVLSFFSEEAPAHPDANLAAMCVRHLLSMSTGHAKDTMAPITSRPDHHWVKGFLSLPVEYEPGTHFLYNTGATYMLSAIIQKVTGMTLLDYLKPRLFEPLGIQNPEWETCPLGINTGGFGLSITTEDIARFGQMYLQKGVFNGRRILPEAWVEEATSKKISNGTDPASDWAQGYCYQFWRCQHNAYRGDGAFGQYCIVMPEQDAVLAITSGLADMQPVLNLAWNLLLPAMQPAALPANPAAHKTLTNKLTSLAIQPLQGAATSSTAARVSGCSYAVQPTELKTESVTFDFSGPTALITLKDPSGAHRLPCAYGAWLKGTTDLLGDRGEVPMVASGAWTADDTFTAVVRMFETPFYFTFHCQFSDEQVTIKSGINVSFGPTEAPTLTGHMQ